MKLSFGLLSAIRVNYVYLPSEISSVEVAYHSAASATLAVFLFGKLRGMFYICTAFARALHRAQRHERKVTFK